MRKRVREELDRRLKEYKAQCLVNNRMERIYADKAATLWLFYYKACRKAEREKTT